MVALDFTDLEPHGVEEAVRARAALILPVAGVAAHGPHLPLSASIVVSNLVAARAVGRLRGRGVEAYRLPAVSYAPAQIARAFPGTMELG
jgi:creatinine amidohydrolase